MPISELNRADLKSAAQRQAVSDKLVRQTLLRHVQELYEARFSPFLMNDSDYQKFKHNITEKVTTMAPSDILKILVDGKWLITANQAGEMIELVQNLRKDMPNLVEAKETFFQDALCCRVFDRWKLRTQGSEGYYIADKDTTDPRRFYVLATSVTDFKPFTAPWRTTPFW
jgi:hypothetical protein